jgi:uncharacterized membrane protein YozB (DUF420 family)
MMIDVSFLPHVNAALNATSFVLITSGFYFIRRGNRVAHRRCMLGAVTAACVFLISYLVYHFNHGATRFKGPPTARAAYLFILTTHTVLAAVVAPMVIVTVRRAWRENFPLHRKIARWTLPLWWYVSVTGVLVYLFLYHFYPSR